MKWSVDKAIQNTRSDVNKMKALIDNWNIMGVQSGKMLALNEVGWEDNKKTHPDSYFCRYCEQSTLEAKWNEISQGFSHKTCVEKNEELINERLGPLAKAPFGVTDDGQVEHRVDLEYEKNLLKLSEQAKGFGIEQQRNPSPLDPEIERCEYSYESYDNGKTIYRKKMGTGITELVEDWDWELENVINGKAVAIADTGWIPRGLTYGS